MLKLKPLILPVLATTLIVLASNILVTVPFTPLGLQDDLTWGAFMFPLCYLVTDLTNRRYGKSMARRLVGIGFVLAVPASYLVTVLSLNPPPLEVALRIAAASGFAYLMGELLDIAVFKRLRQQSWWHAPLAASLIGSALDTALFFTLAFAGNEFMSQPVPFSLLPGVQVSLWQNLAIWDFAVKSLVALIALIPYGALLNTVKPLEIARS